MGCATSSAVDVKEDHPRHELKEEKNVLSASQEVTREHDSSPTPIATKPPAQVALKESASEIVASGSQVRDSVWTAAHGNTTSAPSGQASIDAAIDSARKEIIKNAGVSFESVYSCSKLIGHGAFAKVSICEHRSSKQTYAAKVVAKNLEDPAKQREGVIKEIAIMRTLGDHPNTVRLLEVFEEVDSYVLVMELCNGGELFDQIIAKGHFTEKAR